MKTPSNGNGRNSALDVLHLKQAIRGGGTIIAPDAAMDNAMSSCIQECDNFFAVREQLLFSLVRGLGERYKAIETTEDLVELADKLARGITKRKCEDVEAIIAATGGKRAKGFQYLCHLMGVKPVEPEAPKEDIHG